MILRFFIMVEGLDKYIKQWIILKSFLSKIFCGWIYFTAFCLCNSFILSTVNSDLLNKKPFYSSVCQGPYFPQLLASSLCSRASILEVCMQFIKRVCAMPVLFVLGSCWTPLQEIPGKFFRCFSRIQCTWPNMEKCPRLKLKAKLFVRPL